MTDILAALAQSQAKEKPTPTPQDDHIKDGVWEATLYRLGFDSQYYKEIPLILREDFLNRLEEQND